MTCPPVSGTTSCCVWKRGTLHCVGWPAILAFRRNWQERSHTPRCQHSCQAVKCLGISKSGVRMQTGNLGGRGGRGRTATCGNYMRKKQRGLAEEAHGIERDAFFPAPIAFSPPSYPSRVVWSPPFIAASCVACVLLFLDARCDHDPPPPLSPCSQHHHEGSSKDAS